MLIHENLVTPVTAECDVLVAGGGIAGIAAALSAARNGAKTILVDRGYMLGGLATAGLVTIYLPLCDGRGEQVSFGIAEELLHLSISMGWEADYPNAWLNDSIDPELRKKQRFMVRYNAQIFALLAEEALHKAGVSIRYGQQIAAVHMEGDRMAAAILQGKSGREAIAARSFVDATGDADLFHMAGADTRIFRQGNVLAAWYYRILNGRYDLCQLGACDVPDELRDELGSPELLVPRRFEALTSSELSEMTCLAHQNVLRDLRKHREADPDCVPVTLATIPQVRMTRCIQGLYTLDDSEYDVPFGDSIGKIADWRRRGYVYDVPFRTLYGAKVKNLIAAGRCISATDAMWDISRVIPACAVTGEAAGAAAAMSDDFAALDVSGLQKKLDIRH